MSEGIYALIGAIIGGGITLLGTYLTLQHNTKIELKKMTLSFMTEKKYIIESLIERCSSFDYTGNMEEDEGCVIDEFKVLSEFLLQKSHYFVESDGFQKLQKQLVGILNDKHSSPLEMLHYEMFFNNEMRKFMQSELEATMKQITKQLRR